jgi:hypothetical protein
MKRKKRINLVGKEIKTQRRKVNCIEIKGKIYRSNSERL